MLNMLKALPFASAASPQLGTVTAPIIQLLNDIFGAAIPIIGALGAIYCIFLGVKFAKADEQQEREKAKNALKNAIIGFILIFVLVVVMRLAIPIMEEWVNTSAPAPTSTTK